MLSRVERDLRLRSYKQARARVAPPISTSPSAKPIHLATFAGSQLKRCRRFTKDYGADFSDAVVTGNRSVSLAVSFDSR
jgi:hypothetical protein